MEDFHVRVDRDLSAALADPIVRVGSVHDVTSASHYHDEFPDGGLPFAVITFSFMEPGENPDEPPGIVAIQLHIPQALIGIVQREFADLKLEEQRPRRPPPGR
jgi:hypothetical protein